MISHLVRPGVLLSILPRIDRIRNDISLHLCPSGLPSGSWTSVLVWPPSRPNWPPAVTQESQEAPVAQTRRQDARAAAPNARLLPLLMPHSAFAKFAMLPSRTVDMLPAFERVWVTRVLPGLTIVGRNIAVKPYAHGLTRPARHLLRRQMHAESAQWVDRRALVFLLRAGRFFPQSHKKRQRRSRAGASCGMLPRIFIA
jgi:hypothetical protein